MTASAARAPLPPGSRVALKEWAVVVEALGEGRQILLLRKGGIHERGGRFRVAHDSFFLLPGREHQRRELLKPAIVAGNESTLEERSDRGPIRLRVFACVREAVKLEEPGRAHALDAFHIWNRDYVQMRLDYKPDQPLFVLVLQAYVLPATVEVARLPRYAGCRSWVELDDEISTRGAIPAMPPERFAGEVARLRERLAR